MKFYTTIYLNKNNWSLETIRKFKSDDFFLIVSRDLNEDCFVKLEELKIPYVLSVDFFNDERDSLYTIRDKLYKGEHCLLVREKDFLKYKKLDLNQFNCDVFCKKSESQLIQIVSCVRNLDYRGTFFNLIKSKMNQEFLSFESVLGSWDFWNSICVFQEFLYAKKLIDKSEFSDDFILNFYLSFSSKYKFTIIN